MKIYDVGHKPEEMATPTKSEKPKKYYPSINLSDKELPCLKGSKVGDKMSLLILCEITGTHKRNNDPIDYTLEIKKMGEEGEMKMSKAMEKAMDEHEEKEEE